MKSNKTKKSSTSIWESAMTKEFLSVDNLHSGYGNKPILQGLNLHIKQGEIVAVIGRNGVGKSTFMKSLIGLLPCYSGSINFMEHEICNLAAHQRARLGIGYVPQGREVFPRMTVEENLRMGESLTTGRVSPDRYDVIYNYFPILH